MCKDGYDKGQKWEGPNRSRGGKYTQRNYTRKIWISQTTQIMRLLTLSILESEVKWALESMANNKASGGDGTPAEPFKILKDDAVKVLHSICQQVWRTQQWLEDWKRDNKMKY